MLFSSLTFLIFFLPITIILYYLVDNIKWKNTVFLLSSLVFYLWGEPKFALVLIATIAWTYLSAILLYKIKEDFCRKIALMLSVGGLILILAYFKYFNWIIENVNCVFGSNFNALNIILPLGISFYVFQSISYVADVYYRQVNPQKNLLNLSLYIVMFPSLVAGPIVKYHDIESQISERVVSFDDFEQGFSRFLMGLAKKVLVANPMGEIADSVFNAPIGAFGTSVAWIGAIAYSLQIYFDFSGYSDMAIGLCRMFGFKIPENFNYPYLSRSITEFWRRWHISLSTWFKLYLYIPLGGNRVGKIINYRNLLIVFLATGIWHGASWNFIFWGIYNGLFVVVEKIFSITKIVESKIIYSVLGHFYLLLVVVFGWVFFRSSDISYAVEYIKVMLYKDCNGYILPNHLLNNYNQIIMVIGFLLSVFRYESYSWVLARWTMLFSLHRVLLVILFVLCLSELAASTYNPFIYFRF